MKFKPDAAAELAEAASWYESERPGLGEAFLAEVLEAASRVEEAPMRSPIWPGTPERVGIRRYVMSRFPYCLAYITDPEVFVIAVCHGRRRPGYWLSRLG